MDLILFVGLKRLCELVRLGFFFPHAPRAWALLFSLYILLSTAPFFRGELIGETGCCFFFFSFYYILSLHISLSSRFRIGCVWALSAPHGPGLTQSTFYSLIGIR